MTRGLKSRQVSSTNGEPKPTQEQLDAALLDAYDLMERVVDVTYIVLGDAAKCIKEGRALDCTKLEFGIPRKYIQPHVLSALKEYVIGGEFTDKGFSYRHQGIEVRFKYLTRTYKFFKELDIKIYMPEFYKIANPFDNYWKSRFLIR